MSVLEQIQTSGQFQTCIDFKLKHQLPSMSHDSIEKKNVMKSFRRQMMAAKNLNHNIMLRNMKNAYEYL